MPKSDDNLVYDGDLGRIDPEGPMESLGIECEETIHHYLFRQNGVHLVTVNKEAIQGRLDFAKVRLCVQDAEERYMTWR